MSTQRQQPQRPEWADCRNITLIFGIGKSTLYRLEAEGKIKSASLREEGKKRGKKLFKCSSVAAFIENLAAQNNGKNAH
jgi:hypothetical protein